MLNNIFPTLGRFRFAVQIIMLFFTVYGGALLGTYTVDRLSQALPSLACAYDKTTADACIMWASQRNLNKVGEALAKVQGDTLAKAQAVTLKILIPTLVSIGVFLSFFFLLNKVFCGWICPMGTVQELMYRIGRRLGRPLNRLNSNSVGKVRPVKWLMLLGLVLGLPLLAGMGFVSADFNHPFCQVCPSRIATTLLTVDADQVTVPNSVGTRYFLDALRNAMFGFIIIAALAVRQPFCRICPLLSWNALFQKLSPMKLVKVDSHAKCAKCGVCANACPMDIHEIGAEFGNKAFHEDCTLCGRCAEFCPDDGVIQIKFFGIPLFKSSRDYYKARVKHESPEGTPKKRVIPILSKPAPENE